MGRSDQNHYVFRSEWRFDASPNAVYAALVDVENYPLWWHQIRTARWIDEHSGELVCRSLLPYDLKFVITRDVEDAVNRILRGRLAGDLVGSSQWTISAEGTGTVAVFDEDVRVWNNLIRATGLVARPALRFNHGLMMRSGEAGLRRHLRAISR